MSIMIEDMEMPESCDNCPFHVYHSHYEYICVATPMFYPMNLANSKGIRKDWCPLLEVTEHKTGRWLTSDDLYETGICSYCKQDSQEPISYAVTNFHYCPNCGARMEGNG